MNRLLCTQVCNVSVPVSPESNDSPNIHKDAGTTRSKEQCRKRIRMDRQQRSSEGFVSLDENDDCSFSSMDTTSETDSDRSSSSSAHSIVTDDSYSTDNDFVGLNPTDFKKVHDGVRDDVLFSGNKRQSLQSFGSTSLDPKEKDEDDRLTEVEVSYDAGVSVIQVVPDFDDSLDANEDTVSVLQLVVSQIDESFKGESKIFQSCGTEKAIQNVDHQRKGLTEEDGVASSIMPSEAGGPSLSDLGIGKTLEFYLAPQPQLPCDASSNKKQASNTNGDVFAKSEMGDSSTIDQTTSNNPFIQKEAVVCSSMDAANTSSPISEAENETITELRASLSEAMKKIKLSEESFQDLKEMSEEQNRRLRSSHRTETEKLLNAVASRNKKVSELERSLQNAIDDMTTSIGLEEKVQNLKADMEKSLAQLEEKTERIAFLERSLDETKSELNDIREKEKQKVSTTCENENNTDQIKLHEEIAEKDQSIDKLSKKLRMAEELNVALHETVEKNDKTIASLCFALEDAKTSAREATEQLSHAEGEKAALHEKLKQMKADLGVSRKALERLTEVFKS